MRPFAGRQLEEKKEIFNYQLSRARRTIENAFGIFCSRWRIYRRPICLDISSIDLVISTVCFYNFLKNKVEECTPGNQTYCDAQSIDRELENGAVIPGSWRNNCQPEQLI